MNTTVHFGFKLHFKNASIVFQKVLLLPCVSAQFFSFNTFESSQSLKVSQVKMFTAGWVLKSR